MLRPFFLFVFLIPALSPAYRVHVDEPGPVDALQTDSQSPPGQVPDGLSMQGGQPIEPLASAGTNAGNPSQGVVGIASGLLEVSRQTVQEPQASVQGSQPIDLLASADTHAGDASQSVEIIASGLSEVSGLTVQKPGASFQPNFGPPDGLPPWAKNMYNFVLRWSPLAGVMCVCTFMCFLCTGQKPDHLDYLGVLAHLFVFELLVLILAGGAHTYIADGNDDKTPHLVAKFTGVTIFGCGTVVNIWWLAWQTVRKRAVKSPAAEGDFVQFESAQHSR